jgi:hypothetical protein
MGSQSRHPEFGGLRWGGDDTCDAWAESVRSAGWRSADRGFHVVVVPDSNGCGAVGIPLPALLPR